MFLFYTLVFLIILFLLYIWSIKPNKKRDVSHILGKLYSHRGIHNNKDKNPENSLLSFKMAVEAGYGIELDVQVTKDNIPVIFHDKTLKRACDLDNCVNNYTLKDLKELRLFNSEQYIPTLQEILTVVDGKVPLIVEIKNETTDVSELVYVAEVLDRYKGVYCIESFNPLALIWYKKNRPHIIRGQLSSYFKKSDHSLFRKVRDFFLENLITNILTKPDFIAFNYKYKDMFSFKLCKKLYNPLTAAYTIKTQKALDNNRDNFDLFIFDSFIPK
nr:glycerophosphodiester phosphodiesterase family protein [Tissierella sp.]